MCTNTNTYYFMLSFYGVYIPVLIIMTCVYFKILHVAVTQIRKIKKHEVVIQQQDNKETTTTENIPLVATGNIG